jgi:ElaB/YqjD/DUF883 family membrane-anchored ribosome-binding protein
MAELQQLFCCSAFGSNVPTVTQIFAVYIRMKLDKARMGFIRQHDHQRMNDIREVFEMFINELIERKKNMIRMEAHRYATRKALIGVGIGTAVGVAVGLLVAPKTGKESREYIVKGAKHAVESAKEAVETIKSKFEKPEEAECEDEMK